MEARISDRLRAISALRYSFVELIQQSLTSPYFQYLQNASIVHISLVSTTLIIITSIYAHARTVTLFSFHPVFMTVGSILLIGEGIMAYRNRILLETLSPIMQHNKTTKVRAIHQTCQVLAASFLFLGLMFIFANKVEFHHSIIPKSVHSIFGTILLLLILGQVISGDHKLSNYARSNMTIRRWHGDAGLLVWDMICITVVLGLFEFFGISFALIIDMIMIFISWYIIQLQLLRKSVTGDGDGASMEGSSLEDSSSPLVSARGENTNSNETDEFIP